MLRALSQDTGGQAALEMCLESSGCDKDFGIHVYIIHIISLSLSIYIYIYVFSFLLTLIDLCVESNGCDKDFLDVLV